MKDIRFLGIENDSLLLESEDGEQFRLNLDDDLRRTLRREPAATEEAEQISPREIQIEIRSGVSIADLADRTGASIEYIEKFAATVLDELQHVIASALAVRIQVPGDRFNEPIHAEFGEVVSERLSKNRATGISWSSRKDETGTWMVQCNFKAGSNEQEAIWSFDLRKLVLTPENETALQLQTQTALTPAAKAPLVKPVVADDPLVPTGSIRVDAPAPKPEPVAVPTPVKPAIDTSAIDLNNMATTTDLTDILRKRAAEAAEKTTTLEVVPEPESQSESVAEPVVVEPVTEAIPKTDKTQVVDLDATQPIEPAPKKGRIPVQSWEEILLSTRSEDDQAN